MFSRAHPAALLCAAALLIWGCEARETAPNGAASTEGSATSQGDGQRRAGGGSGKVEIRTHRGGQTTIPLPLYPPPANADAARWEGMLGLKGRCLVITGDGSAAFAVPVFAEGQARWDDETRTLTFKDKHYAIGDRIVVGGSFNNLGRPGLPVIRDLSPDCPGDSVWLVG